ncbi:hypothetical protein [Maribacter sp. 2307ULW6-5]|uniref:hypothetical protein n=1 Tax=Maribacter sp. 2307ULW6-5 TaxID=3386275 RepID=UPI0039BD76FD
MGKRAILYGILLMMALPVLSCGKDAEPNVPEEENVTDPPTDPEDGNGPVEGPDPNPNEVTYLERNGIVSVEFESVTGDIEWERRSALEGFDGDGYLVWNKPDNFREPGNGVLTYRLTIGTTGTYRFIWRSRITEGDTQSEANDSWLRFNDAADFFGERNGSLVYPKGSGKTPNPEGNSADGWLKVYMNRLGEWFWRSNTSDNDPHDIYVTFDEPGTYTMEVSGRSQFHGLDRFVLFVEGTTFNEARDAERSERRTP